MEHTYYVMSQATADCIRKYGTVGQRMKYLLHRAKSPKWLAHKLYDVSWYARWMMDNHQNGPIIYVTHAMAFAFNGEAHVFEYSIDPFTRAWNGSIQKRFAPCGEEWESEPNPNEIMAFLNETADIIEGKMVADFRRNLISEHPEWLEVKQISSLPTFYNNMDDNKTEVRYVEPSAVRKEDGSIVGEPAEKTSKIRFRDYTNPYSRPCAYHDLVRYSDEKEK